MNADKIIVNMVIVFAIMNTIIIVPVPFENEFLQIVLIFQMTLAVSFCVLRILYEINYKPIIVLLFAILTAALLSYNAINLINLNPELNYHVTFHRLLNIPDTFDVVFPVLTLRIYYFLMIMANLITAIFMFKIYLISKNIKSSVKVKYTSSGVKFS
jgi:hypothetical protein